MQTIEDAHFLLTDEAQAVVKEISLQSRQDEQVFKLNEALRKRFSPSQASALITLARLRNHAESRFPNAAQLYFTRESLEQATAWEIAKYRAVWLNKHAQPGPILDLGCGIGGDLLHLAKYRKVIAYESDPIRACFARANAQVMGLEASVEVREADWQIALKESRLPSVSAAFVDPARRVNGQRIFNVEQMIPPLSSILQLQSLVPSICIKLMPGIQDQDIPPNGQVKFISHQGTCKEAMLWLGTTRDLSLRSESIVPSRSAAIHRPNGWLEIIASEQVPPIGPLSDGYYLHEPDPALIRAGAFWELCQQLKGWLFDPQIAYLVTCDQQVHPLVQTFRLLEVLPFNLKKLNVRISALNIGTVELKKRGMPFEPESLRKKLKLVPNGRAVVILFTRRGDERLMLIAERV